MISMFLAETNNNNNNEDCNRQIMTKITNQFGMIPIKARVLLFYMFVCFFVSFLLLFLAKSEKASSIMILITVQNGRK